MNKMCPKTFKSTHKNPPPPYEKKTQIKAALFLEASPTRDILGLDTDSQGQARDSQGKSRDNQGKVANLQK